MIQERNIHIDKERLFDDLQRLTQTIGRTAQTSASSEGDAGDYYDMIALTSQDKDTIDSFAETALSNITDIMRKYFVGGTDDTLTIGMPSEFSPQLFDRLNVQVYDAVRTYCLYCYLNTITDAVASKLLADKIASLASQYQLQIDGAKRLFYTREIPHPRRQDEEIDILIRFEDIVSYVSAKTNKAFNSRFGQMPAEQINEARYESTYENETLLANYVKKYDALVRSRLAAYLSGRRKYDRNDYYGHRLHGMKNGEHRNERLRYDSSTDKTDDLVYVLDMPKSWDESMFGLLCQSIQDYICNMACFEFVAIADASSASTYKALGDINYSDIKKALTARETRQSRPFYGIG